MTTLSDWKDRYNRLNDATLQLQNLVESSERNTRGTKDLIEAVDSLEKKKAILDSKQKDYERDASTFDREFLERKSGFPDPFYPSKLYTIQDFILFFLFVGYTIFVVALSLSFPSSQGKVLLGGFVGLLLISIGIIRFG